MASSSRISENIFMLSVTWLWFGIYPCLLGARPLVIRPVLTTPLILEACLVKWERQLELPYVLRSFQLYILVYSSDWAGQR